MPENPLNPGKSVERPLGPADWVRDMVNDKPGAPKPGVSAPAPLVPPVVPPVVDKPLVPPVVPPLVDKPVVPPVAKPVVPPLVDEKPLGTPTPAPAAVTPAAVTPTPPPASK